MTRWEIIGQIGNIIKKDNCYLVNIADNKYKPKNKNEWEKDYTTWFSCICDFKPNISIGDKVIAIGEFLPSNNENYKYVMKIKHIAVIQKSV